MEMTQISKPFWHSEMYGKSSIMRFAFAHFFLKFVV